jgi:hypothetical protein
MIPHKLAMCNFIPDAEKLAKRVIAPNSRFKGKENVLPGGDKPVILIYHFVEGQS